jgi:hypothetical protein
MLLDVSFIVWHAQVIEPARMGAASKPLAKQLDAAGAQDDPEILQKAEELLKQADEAGSKRNIRCRCPVGRSALLASTCTSAL